ncbi:MAG: CRISPR system precrRNA processing endoribonuclease RAMP protein Cas6 [Rhodoplanes sp.]|uniref:CRISPR system precrRNA processing endoribonuclease RAMP protein Cas6 n=1 Tax=Rhodoplanes sp. TaxID=1968906 RepID=UPI0017F34621|nr:CRISPR system precrRNA processing endoribonuclease RAMP protein Cas6 [Rhodoplanes sp.]NVO14048.1 CRISPR system precrRNA processing endoribonuclease RAMP protein Cas6 [Rhodoplanes sp.]
MPLIEATPDELVLMWTQEEVRVICARPADLEDHPDLAMRVRGAFGRMLALAGPPVGHRHDPFDRPPPFPALFGTQDEDATRPFTIDVDVLADIVQVDLRLFGSAAFWVDQCRDALLAALAGGISIKAGSRHRQPLQPLDCLMRRVCAELPPRSVGAVNLACVTPVAVRAGHALLSAPPALLYAAVTRARRLARWLDVKLVADWTALRQACEQAHVVQDRLLPYRAVRSSQRQRDRRIPVSGLLGEFSVEGALTPLAPFLMLAAQTHIGSHAALGMGRVRPALYP